MSDDKWSNDMIVQFLEIYERHNILWDRRQEDYTKREARELELKKVIEELNEKDIHIDSTTLRLKINTFKTVYNQELDKVLLSQRKEDSKGIYKPKLFWFDKADRFLRSVTNRKNPKIYKLRSSIKRMITEDEDGVEKITKRKSRMKTNKTNTCTTFKDDDVHKADRASPFFSARALELDELDHFGNYVVASLRRMPSINILRCHQEIQTVITNERIQLLSQQHSGCEIIIHDEDT